MLGAVESLSLSACIHYDLHKEPNDDDDDETSSALDESPFHLLQTDRFRIDKGPI